MDDPRDINRLKLLAALMEWIGVDGVGPSIKTLAVRFNIRDEEMEYELARLVGKLLEKTL